MKKFSSDAESRQIRQVTRFKRAEKFAMKKIAKKWLYRRFAIF